VASVTLGYHLSTEEHPPVDLVRYAQMAESVGFRFATIAARVGDGLISTSPQSGLVEAYDEAGGRGKPHYGQMSVCSAKDMATACHTAYASWRTVVVPGALHAKLPLPQLRPDQPTGRFRHLTGERVHRFQTAMYRSGVMVRCD
jgi:hypothetical protein